MLKLCYDKPLILNTPFVPSCLSELALSGGRYESAKAGYGNTSASHKKPGSGGEGLKGTRIALVAIR